MSFRGGRGGRRGGGGGGLKGTLWEHDPNLELDNKPSELFPAYSVPEPQPLTARTKREVSYYRNLKDQIYQGPLYTRGRTRDPTESRRIYGEEHANSLYASKSKAEIDPFTGVPTYSMKYDQKTRSVPQLSARPFVKELFPKELWPTLDGDETSGTGRKKKLILSTNAYAISTDELAAKAMDAEARTKALMEKLENVPDEDDPEANAEEGEEEEEEEDHAFDDEFGAEDYDGEGYFDGGEGDDMDDDDGGGGEYW